MANSVIGYNNIFNNATLSGGSWQTGFGIDKLKTRYLYQSAISSSATATISMDFGSIVSVGVIGVLSLGATIQASSGSFQIIGSNNSNFSSPVYSFTDDLAGEIPNITHDLGQSYSARYWKIVIVNQSSGFSIGRVFVGSRFQSAINISYGASFGYQSATEVTESQGGYEFFYEKPTRRIARVVFDSLTDAESVEVDSIMQSVGLSGEVIFFRDPSDSVNKQRRNIYGRLSALNALDVPYFDNYSTGFDIIEMVA
jgi:hypothetical protein